MFKKETIHLHTVIENDLGIIHFLFDFSYFLGFVNFEFSDDSEMKPCKDLDKYYLGGERILGSAETFRDWLVD